jgi:hypothetical protein
VFAKPAEDQFFNLADPRVLPFLKEELKDMSICFNVIIVVKDQQPANDYVSMTIKGGKNNKCHTELQFLCKRQIQKLKLLKATPLEKVITCFG